VFVVLKAVQILQKPVRTAMGTCFIFAEAYLFSYFPHTTFLCVLASSYTILIRMSRSRYPDLIASLWILVEIITTNS